LEGDRNFITAELVGYKQRLVQDVHCAYSQRGSSLGDERFSRWMAQIVLFLDSNLPGQSRVLKSKVYKPVLIARSGESVVSRFWRRQGEPATAYIDSLIMDIQSGEYTDAAISEPGDNMPLNTFPAENARVEKKNGAVVGPYKATFAGDVIIVKDALADIEEGDVILRQLPNGRDERSHIIEVNFYNSMTAFGAHYQLKIQKAGTSEMKNPTNTFNIHGGQVQIGDNNTQNIVNALNALKEKIDAADATPEQKSGAKELLSNLIAHPLITSVLGGLAGAAL
jgi:hypothetical protein